MESRSVVVIGAGGIGAAAAVRLGPGRRLVLADHAADVVDVVCADLDERGYRVEGHVVDVSDRTSVAKLAAVAAGHLDAVVHAAGVSPEMGATVDEICRIDLLGTVHVIEEFLPAVGPGTAMVCVSSLSGHLAPLSPALERHFAMAPADQLLDHDELDLSTVEPMAAYAIAKRANHLRVQAAAHDYGSRGARINTVSPGVIATAMGRRSLDGPSGPVVRQLLDLAGARRAGTPEDVAAVIEFLVGPGAAYITGADLLVDGGTFAAQRWQAGV